MKYRLRCLKCGTVTETDARDRRCKKTVDVVQGLNPVEQRWCWGQLVKLTKKKSATPSDLEQAAYCATMADAAARRMKRAMTSFDKWNKRQAYYLKKAEGGIRVRTVEKKPKVTRHTRAIDLD